MSQSITVASYLPESMLIKIGPQLRILDETGAPEPFPNARAFGFFFHEYVHYLHNISTISGITTFLNTTELWRSFRLTMRATGHSVGSFEFEPQMADHLAQLLDFLAAARRDHTQTMLITSPASITVLSYSQEVAAKGRDGSYVTLLACKAEIRDASGETESLTVRLGTLELLEGAAWLLETRVVKAIDSLETAEFPPLLPYRLAEAVAVFATPGIQEGGILACILGSLQSSDAPTAFTELLAIARDALRRGDDIVACIRISTRNALAESESRLEQVLISLAGEFSGNGIMAIAVRRIIDAARSGFAARREDPFFELQTINKLESKPGSINEVLRGMPSCAVLQQNYGAPNEVGRDYLLSFLPKSENSERDPEDGLRVVHGIFDYVRRHRRANHFVPTSDAVSGKCPFYSCCTLSLRREVPSVCCQTPWEAVDWPGWHENVLCWYGTGVRITRPPP